MTPGGMPQAEIESMLATGGWWLRRAGQAGEETKPSQCFTEGGLVRELGQAIAQARTSAQVRGLRELNRETVAGLPPPLAGSDHPPARRPRGGAGRGGEATMTETWVVFEEHARAKPWGASWLINAPWAHPVWSQYLVALYDLTTPAEKAPVIHLDGATHEMMLFALHPEHRVVRDKLPSEQQQNIRPLQPPNLGYQFRAESDAAARNRIAALVARVEARQLSPDTDFRSEWSRRMADGYSMVRSALGELAKGRGQ